MSELKVQIKNLYKIFGKNPKKVLPQVKSGLGKPELLDQTGHVLGINNVSLDIPAKQIQVVMGLSGSGKSTLIRHINRLIEPGRPTQSRLLMHPLHPDGGGDYAHNGVRRWLTQDDPEWRMLAAWINGERTGADCRP